MVITQRGKGLAVVLDVAEYEAMQEKIDLLEEMRTAESGLSVSNENAHGLYKKYGFIPLRNLSPFMEIYMPDIYAQALYQAPVADI